MISPYFTRNVLSEFTKERVACDPQRVNVYQMEREFVGISVSCPTPRRILQQLANHACRYYRVRPIKVVVYVNRRDRRFGESFHYIDWNEKTQRYDGRQHSFKIRLNRAFHGAHAVVLMHELAHHITDQLYTDHEDHGKQFVGIYMHLLDKYKIFPSACFRLLAKKHSVKIAGKFKPDAINRKA